MTPIDRMDPEAYPWPKRYKTSSINLRRFFHSYYTAAASVNYATHSLFNASPGDRVLIVRGLSYTGFSAAAPQYFFAQQGIIGTHTGSEQPTWLGERAGNGQHCYVDAAAASTPQLFYNLAVSGIANFLAGPPLFVIPPGWSVALQQNTKILTTTASFWWEELAINDPLLGAIGQFG